jgi:hypothetical protein
MNIDQEFEGQAVFPGERKDEKVDLPGINIDED